MNDNMSIYKPDWKEARQRMTDWWNGKKVDRVIANVSAQIEPPAQPRSSALITDVPIKYIDFDTVFNNLEYGLERRFWGGESFPMHFVYFGPMFSVAFFGCEPNFTANTTWYKPCYKSLDDLLKNFSFDRNNHWWLLYKEMTHRSAQRAEGRYLTSLCGITSIIDIIAELIGPEKMLMSMIEDPDKLKTARDKIAILGKESFEELFKIIYGYCDGIIDWMGVWSNKKIQTNQCDSSVMISPDMFRNYVLEDIESTYAYLDYGIYHLDGEEQIRHLDILLSIETIKIIQWAPSCRINQPEYRDPLNWLSLFKRIQDAGKSVLIYCPPERVSELLQKIDRQKTILQITCPDMKTANKILFNLDKIGV